MFKRILILAATSVILTGCYHQAISKATPVPQTNGGAFSQTRTQPTASPDEAVAAADSATVEIKNFAFSPATMTVKPGAKITITNQDIPGHSFTSDDGKSFDTKVIAQGKSATITAPTTPGSYPFHCTPHPNMKGTLSVEE
jgi:plastocyanin